MNKFVMLSLLCASTVTFADPVQVSGTKATELARALKFAGVKPVSAKNARTFKVSEMHCSQTKEGKVGDLGDYWCDVDKRRITDGIAYLLQNAMEDAGFHSDDHMSQHSTDGNSISCTIDSTKAGDAKFTCAFSAAVAK